MSLGLYFIFHPLMVHLIPQLIPFPLIMNVYLFHIYSLGLSRSILVIFSCFLHSPLALVIFNCAITIFLCP